jgi:hypothetical protein
MEDIAWTYAGADPSAWDIYNALTALGPFSLFDSVSGSTFSYPGVDGGKYYYVVSHDVATPGADDSNILLVP